ncbi:hypothetical protein pb186bvf_008242 [Paramecium bursaria]
MPAIEMNIDYTKRKRPQTAQKQLAVSPIKVRFNKFDHVKLGVIHPEPPKRAKSATKQTDIKSFNRGEQGFMEIEGHQCPKTDILPDVVFTKNDKSELPMHLIQPFIYIQKIFPKSRPVEDTHYEHKDVFCDFQTLNESKRNNKNLPNEDFIQQLKQMTKEERQAFYSTSTNFEQIYVAIFKRFVKAICQKGLFTKEYKFEIQIPKIPIGKLEEIAIQNKYTSRMQKNKSMPVIKSVKVKDSKKPKIIKEYDQLPINPQNMAKYLEQLNYPKQFIKQDIEQLFKTVIKEAVPLNMVIKSADQKEELISLSAFLYNVQKCLKYKYQIKKIFSHNAAKGRNVFIKYAFYPFLNEGWKAMKKCLSNLKQQESKLQVDKNNKIKELIQQRDFYIFKMRVLAKNLQRTPLQFILIQFQKLQQIYGSAINFNADRIEKFIQFCREFFDYRQQAIREQNEFQIASNDANIQDFLDFVLQMGYHKDDSKEIIEMMRKSYKYQGMVLFNQQKSKYKLQAQSSSNFNINHDQIYKFLQHYSAKQNNEWQEFFKFLDSFKTFIDSKLLKIPQDRLQNVRKELEANMIAEWIVRLIKKDIKQVESKLGKSVQLIQLLSQNPNATDKQIDEILNGVFSISLSQFMSEETQDLISNAIKEQSTSTQESSLWDGDIRAAMARYQEITDTLQKVQIQQNIPQKPTQIIQQSAQELIDSRPTPVTVKRAQSPKQEVKKQQSPPQKQYEPPQQKLPLQQTQPRALTEKELDEKILKAQKLQGQIFSELGKFKMMDMQLTMKF